MPNYRIIAPGGEAYLSAITGTNQRRMTNPQKPAPSTGSTRRKTMKTMLLAAAAALSLGIGSAYADSEGGQITSPSSPRPRASSPRLRRRTPRPSRRRRTGRRCRPTSPSRATAPGSRDPMAVTAPRADPSSDRETKRAGTTAGLFRLAAQLPRTRGMTRIAASLGWSGGSVQQSTRAVAQVTARGARGRHPGPGRSGSMRAYFTVVGMALGLVAVWAALVPFVA